MKSNLSRSQRILLFALALLVVVLILLLPRTPEKKEAVLPAVSGSTEFSFKDSIDLYKSALDPERKEKIISLEGELAGATDTPHKMMWCDSLALYWRIFGKPEVETEYLKMYAALGDSVKSWFVAGDGFFNNYRKVNEPLKKYMIDNAIECYNRILELEPGNLKAKNAMGVCYVEGATHLGVQPMKGIGIIREVLQEDPANIDALVNLGYFAIKSGQYDKAIERYNQVLEIDPAHIEAYIYLTDIYVNLGEKNKAVSSLEKYKSHIKDQVIIAQIDEYIEEIKKSN